MSEICCKTWWPSMATVSCMFERPHHQRIAQVLDALDGDLLTQAKCYFGGGTAIALLCGEFRESVDIDFLCADQDGYRLIREAIAPPRLGRLLRHPVTHRRDVRTERDKISTFLEVDGTPIKFELVREARITFEDTPGQLLGVPVLDRVDLYAEKLLANADRGQDRSQKSRDMIDLAMMIDTWGAIPDLAVEKAVGAYGLSILRAFDNSLALLNDPAYLRECLVAMGMDEALGEMILALLHQHRLE